ncbi:MAG TPA: BatA and WFA domain-containing protein [Anaerolineae bacterium]|nr:BatA and WFA domain-containing protein [Anaerolineae bacterium]
MGFLTPFFLLFAALSIPILILYMLKLRRRDVLVSSTLLWQRLLRDREANAPWQRLRRNLLLLLQLLILAFLTLALARPFVPAPAVVSGSVVVLLDASASMQATDVEPTRFEAARRAAQGIVAGLRVGDVATIIAVGPQPQVLASATSDRVLLRRALEGAAPTNGPADWENGFALAAAGLAGMQDAGLVIISDGALPQALPALPGQVRFVGVGGGGDNLAIVALATRGGPAGPQAFLRVVNCGDVDAEPLVEFFANGVLFDARRLSVPAHASAGLTLTDLPYDVQVLQARLAVEDALPLDNTAWAVHVSPVSGRVLLVSSGNLFLERALGVLPGVELVRLTPGQPLPAEPYDLYVYDGMITGTLPAGNLWLIAPSSPLPPRERLGEGEDSPLPPREGLGEGEDSPLPPREGLGEGEDSPLPLREGLGEGGLPIGAGGFFTATTITRVLDDDPLLRHVDLSTVHILQARRVEPPPEARVLVEAEGGPLLFVAERPEGRLAVLAFDLHDSDLPLQVAFPILVANLTNWLLPGGAARLPVTVRPADAVPIQPDPEATDVRVTAPDGTRYTLPVGGEPAAFAATDQLGVYRVEQLVPSGAIQSVAYFAVNLFDEGESDIRPQDTVRVGQAEVVAQGRAEEGRREFWPWLAGAALAVLAVEWWAYQVGTGETRRQGDRGTRRKRGLP